MENKPLNKNWKKKVVLSGIRPTGSLHLGNYFGAIIQFLELQKAGANCYYFVADLHALTSIQKKDSLQKNTLEIVKSYIACGIDPEKALIYKQSDILEIPYLTTILSAITPEGLQKVQLLRIKQPKKIVSLGLLKVRSETISSLAALSLKVVHLLSKPSGVIAERIVVR